MKDRSESLEVLEEYIESEALKHHCKMVATATEAYAISLEKSKDEIEKWWNSKSHGPFVYIPLSSIVLYWSLLYTFGFFCIHL